MRIISLFILLVASLTLQAQSFEGKITYRNIYKSKVAQVSDEQFGQMLGTEQAYFISGANYKSVLNGNMVKEQLYPIVLICNEDVASVSNCIASIIL